ncbi:MAG TPA: hypothetical protein VEH06_17645, partial [Candidatus Bathyarchaeia archaeon]|nr:hypothetical protein [Candidatus Bathyarchaeia archaeon]
IGIHSNLIALLRLSRIWLSGYRDIIYLALCGVKRVCRGLKASTGMKWITTWNDYFSFDISDRTSSRINDLVICKGICTTHFTTHACMYIRQLTGRPSAISNCSAVCRRPAIRPRHHHSFPFSPLATPPGPIAKPHLFFSCACYIGGKVLAIRTIMTS